MRPLRAETPEERVYSPTACATVPVIPIARPLTGAWSICSHSDAARACRSVPSGSPRSRGRHTPPGGRTPGRTPWHWIRSFNTIGCLAQRPSPRVMLIGLAQRLPRQECRCRAWTDFHANPKPAPWARRTTWAVIHGPARHGPGDHQPPRPPVGRPGARLPTCRVRCSSKVAASEATVAWADAWCPPSLRRDPRFRRCAPTR